MDATPRERAKVYPPLAPYIEGDERPLTIDEGLAIVQMEGAHLCASVVMSFVGTVFNLTAVRTKTRVLPIPNPPRLGIANSKCQFGWKPFPEVRGHRNSLAGPLRNGPPPGVQSLKELTEIRSGDGWPSKRSSRKALRASGGTSGKGKGASLLHEEVRRRGSQDSLAYEGNRFGLRGGAGSSRGETVAHEGKFCCD